jgi:hypothetical protein
LAVGGRAGLGTLLTGAFIFQVTSSIRAAYRTTRLTGLGCTGVTASILMLTRITSTLHRPREELVLGAA